MRKLLFISIILVFASCKKLPKNNVPVGTIATDTISHTEIPLKKSDTLTKISEPFQLNNMLCYWKHSFIIYDDYGFDITMELKSADTRSTLFEYEYAPKYTEDYDYKSNSYFDTINKRHFRDVNFDGFKDFVIRSFGSMPMTSQDNIYLFNRNNKTFEYSEDLSDNTIEEVDNIKKILTTSSFTRESTSQRKHHFDKAGKLLFSEETFEGELEISDTILSNVVRYKKIINGKVVEIKTDTIRAE